MKYLVSFNVIAEGKQYFTVEAENDTEACDKIMSSKGKFEFEELEVKDIDWNSMKVHEKS